MYKPIQYIFNAQNKILAVRQLFKLIIMKKYITIFVPAILLLLLFSACHKDGAADMTTVAIQDPVRHYSPVVQGEEQQIAIKVFNTGSNLLNILDVYPSCGCTIAKFSQSAIAPGKYGLVELTYNSNKNMGYVGVYTTIVTNSLKKSSTVFFDLNVVPDADYIRDYEQLHMQEYKTPAPIKKLVDGRPVTKGYTIHTPDTIQSGT